MDFKILLEKITPSLKYIARKHMPRGFYSEDDLYQEMCLYLWQHYAHGLPIGINEAYAIKGCEFHILNYLRKVREKIVKKSLEEEINENGDTLKDILASREEPLDNYIDKKLTIDYIMNNGFSKREKEVFSLLIKGYTVREAGRVLGISHVMVVKLKASLVKKYQRDIKKGVTKNKANLLN